MDASDSDVHASDQNFSRLYFQNSDALSGCDRGSVASLTRRSGFNPLQQAGFPKMAGV